ncbi:MAG: hypothetical protein ACXACX_20515 [Candidatus Hodarchaeales archaeon]|jgi:hypothetical protein
MTNNDDSSDKKKLLALFNILENLPLDETDKEQNEFDLLVESGKDHNVEAISHKNLVFINEHAPMEAFWTGKSDITNTVQGLTPRYFFNLGDNKSGELLCKSRVFNEVVQRIPKGQKVVIFKSNNGRWALK